MERLTRPAQPREQEHERVGGERARFLKAGPRGRSSEEADRAIHVVAELCTEEHARRLAHVLEGGLARIDDLRGQPAGIAGQFPGLTDHVWIGADPRDAERRLQVRHVDMDRSIVRAADLAEQVEQRDDGGHGSVCGRDCRAALREIGGQCRGHLAIQMMHEHAGGRCLPPRGQPGDRLLVGGDRVAGALRADHEVDAERRIEPLPEGHVHDLLESGRGLLVVEVLEVSLRSRDAVGQSGQLLGDLGRCGSGPQIHPGGSNLARCEQRPAHLAAGGERPFVELVAISR